MSLASLSIKRPSFVLSIVLCMLAAGLICHSRLGLDMLPDVTFPMVMVMTPYRGAGPEEIEETVTKPLEEELNSLPNLNHLSSTNQEGVSILVVEFKIGTDVKAGEQAIRDKVAMVRATKLPQEVEDSVYKRMDMADTPVLRLSLSTRGLSPAQIYAVAKNDLKPMLEKINNVATIEIIGGREREIEVLLDRDKLKRREISLTSVAARIGANSQNVPVGAVDDGSQQMMFRVLGDYRGLDQIRKTAVNFYGSDNPVAVQDVGEVRDSVKDPETFAYFNGSPAVFVDVYKQSGSNTVSVAGELNQEVRAFNARFNDAPGHPLAEVVADNSRPIKANIDDVKQAFFLGLILTIVVVYFFLGSGRSTVVTGAALPNSLIGGFILMYLMGFTLNIVTLMALSMAVGLLIDDAIVVRENIWRHMERGLAAEEAAVRGTQEVSLAVIATTSVIVSVFLPVALMGGFAGMFFKQLGLTVVFAMVISLLDALTMAPLLSFYLAAKGAKFKERLHSSHWAVYNPMRWLRRAVELSDGFQKGLSAFYDKAILYCLGHRFLVLGTALAIFAASLGLARFVKVSFMPNQESGQIVVRLKAGPGTSLEGMRAAALEVDTALRGKHAEIAKTALQVGNTQRENNVASIYVELVPFHQRKTDTGDMAERLRQDLRAFPDLKPSVGLYDPNVGFIGTSPFTLLVTGDNLEEMGKTADELALGLKKIPGLTDISVDYDPGKPEYQVVLDPARMRALGVSAVTSGMEMRGLVDGLVPAKFRDGRDDVDIRVRLKQGQRDLRQGLDKFRVPNMNYNLIRLSDVGRAVLAQGPTKITRRDRQRIITLTAELAPGGTLGAATAGAEKLFKETKFPSGVKTVWAGQGEIMGGMAFSMVLGMGLAMLLMYLVLVSLYESTVQPLLIMLALPLAVVGAIGALLITRIPLDLMTMMGFIMLMGLVAKNSILLVDYANQWVRKGMDVKKALMLAGKVRLRPILMTTAALIAGMLPLAVAFNETAKFRQSMGVAVIGGLLSSTLLTLLVIPAAYEIFDDARAWLRRFFGRPALRQIEIQERKKPKPGDNKG